MRRTSVLYFVNYLSLEEPIESRICRCLLNAFTSVLESSKLFPTNGSLNIVYVALKGPLLEHTTSFANTILMEIPIEYLYGIESKNQRNCRKKDLIVVLFDCSLEFPNCSSYPGRKYEIGNETDDKDISDRNGPSLEVQILCEVATMFHRSGIDLVCCQKRIHPFLKRKLLSMGIRSLSNISVRYMNAIAQLSVFLIVFSGNHVFLLLLSTQFLSFIKINYLCDNLSLFLTLLWTITVITAMFLSFVHQKSNC